MAIDTKSIIANALLELCEKKPLNKISVTNIQDKTGISRQTFYNHFRDKHDLIQYIYCERIVVNWVATDLNLDFYDSIIVGLERYAEYHSFLKQACQMIGQNCLKDFMVEHCKKFDYDWHLAHLGKDNMPQNLKFATDYHSVATMSMKIEWVLSDMACPIEVLAENIIRMRNAGLSSLFFGPDPSKSPYAKAVAKIDSDTKLYP